MRAQGWCLAAAMVVGISAGSAQAGGRLEGARAAVRPSASARAPASRPPRTGIYGDPCEYINVCDPGLFCANADAVPDCGGSIGCCSEFCDLEDATGDAQCSGVAGGQACVPWTEDPSPGLEAVGACVIPA